MSTQEQASTFIDYYSLAEDLAKRRKAAEAATLSSDRNLGIASVNFDALARLLQLPEGHRILSVWASPKDLDVVEIRIEGPGMPKVRLGDVIPEVRLVIKT